MEITILTCHFGDRFWISQLLSAVAQFSDSSIREIVVVDQSRKSEEWLLGQTNVNRVLTFPENHQEIALMGHDHASSLNRALSETIFTTSHILIMDSDCFPIRSGWLDNLANVTLASVPKNFGLSHPCFMLFPTSVRRDIDFQEGIYTIGMDTGRLVAAQLARAGFKVFFTQPTPAFQGLRGNFYLDGKLYHHAAGSFLSSINEVLLAQVNARQEIIFRRRVQTRDFNLSILEFAEVIIIKIIRILHRQLTRAKGSFIPRIK